MRSALISTLGAPRARSTSVLIFCCSSVPLDVLVIIGSGALAYVVWLTGGPQVSWADYGVISVIGALLAINVFYLSGLYKFETIIRPRIAFQKLATAWIGVGSFLIALSFFTRSSEDYSRLWSLIWFVTAFALLALLRFAFFAAITVWIAKGRIRWNIAIVGSDVLTARLIQRLSRPLDKCVRIVGVFDDRPTGRCHNAVSLNGDLDVLVEYIQGEMIDTVILAIPWSEEKRILTTISRLRILPVDVHLCPDSFGVECDRPRFAELGGISMLHLSKRPFSDWKRAIKVIEDVVVAAFILPLISPLLLAIAALIKLDSRGSVFFRQKCYGYNSLHIEALKFRTTYHSMRDIDGQSTKCEGARITRLGKYLRKWGLDALPQFLNVLRGEMSVVGPHPHAVLAKGADVPYQTVRNFVSRYRVKPGITGWAQINGWHGETETPSQLLKCVECDVYYVENWSLWLDLKILLLTIVKELRGRRAIYDTYKLEHLASARARVRDLCDGGDALYTWLRHRIAHQLEGFDSSHPYER